MDLAQEIKQYYFENLDKLSDDKRFHFASRIAAWESDPRAYELLRQLKNYLLQPDMSLKELFAKIIAKPQTGKRNAHDLRQPYFQKYPMLYGLHSALFRARHLKTVWGIDVAPALFAVFPKHECEKLYEKLGADTEAIRALSTFGVNFMYLYKNLIGQRESIDPSFFVNIARGYNLSDHLQIQLLIYLYTHTIIGETNFYTESISDKHLPIFKKMLKELGKVIDRNFADINLDNKLEFLVCCRICEVDSPLFEKIYDECQKSISPEGLFLIDTHNTNAQTSRNNFNTSEHRNVLFVMSSSPYRPHSILIS